MALSSIVSLKSFKATSKQKFFVIEFSTGKTKTFAANVEDDDNEWNLSSGKNIGCFADADTSAVIHNMYDMQKTMVHSLATRQHKYPYEDEFDYQHIYRSPFDMYGNQLSDGCSQMSNVIQAWNTIYMIDGMSKYGHCYINDDLHSWLAKDNGFAFPCPHEIQTYLYDKSQLSNLSAAVTSVMYNVGYNTLYEIPGNIQQDYQSGALFGTTVKCKNQYDSTYSMKHTSNSALTDARTYLEVCNCNDLVYLKYRDGETYTKLSSMTLSSFSFDETGREITHIFLEHDSSSSKKVPSIEVLGNLNRGITPTNHKSTLYSLKLNTKFLSTLDLNPKIKDNLKTEIKSCIRKIAERLAPANAQLFSVTVS